MILSQPEPNPSDEPTPDSSDSVLVIIDGPGDTTHRPRPANIPPYSPRGKPPAPPQSEQPPPEKPG
jgi:hypothetical protein